MACPLYQQCCCDDYVCDMTFNIHLASTCFFDVYPPLFVSQVDPVTGERQVKTEAMTKNDAMLFPFIGSTALLGLYFAYKFLSPYWVNLLITLYLTFFGCAALGETFTSITVRASRS